MVETAAVVWVVAVAAAVAGGACKQFHNVPITDRPGALVTDKLVRRYLGAAICARCVTC